MAYPRRTEPGAQWTLREADKHFSGSGKVYDTLRAIAHRLEELQIPYAVVGGLALFQHGYRRFTEDVDILVRKEGLAKLHEKLEGRGYLPKFEGSKNLRDTETGVTIEFLVSGEYPGDGKSKPVAFPDPEGVGTLIDGIRYLNLAPLIELKLSSGMTSPERLRDLADVQQLIRVLRLPAGFAERLAPYVRAEFQRLCAPENEPKRFIRIWTGNQRGLDSLLTDGVQVQSGSIEEGRCVLVTDDPELAAKYGMHEEDEFM